jgi:hypothetical protein
VLKALRRGDPVAVGNAIRRDLADAADVILANVEFISDRPLDDDGEDAPKRRRAGQRPERSNRKRIAI